MAVTTITVRDNGPYRITGAATITDSDGTTIEGQGAIVLCRCGHSANKPFCDAAHKTAGFASAPRADTPKVERTGD